MAGASQTVFAFAVPFVVGRVAEFALGTQWGKDLATSTGNAQLASDEGRHLVRRYSGAAAAAAATLAFVMGRLPSERSAAKADRVQMVTYASEILLAAGALLKVGADYLKDRQVMTSKAG
ncbi:MAG: hypothetical protein M1401_15570 [Chloroflexi bacterium]|nr:hypothetical protein [Chloroflexota bacterium]MCL5110247.1 hypothetical protein [Chloroflexota bacterium]